MMSQPNSPLRYDYQDALLPETGLSQDDVKSLEPRLETARAEVIDDARAWAADDPVPPGRLPLDAGFHHLPERLLEEFRRDASASELGRIQAAASQLANQVDAAVVLGIGGSYMGMRALFEACCHPYHNELSRERRHGQPRLYFEGNNVDNDALVGLIDLLSGGSDPGDLDAWGIIPISKSGGTLETAIALRRFLDLLESACGGDAAKVASRVVPVTGPSGRLFDLVAALGCRDVFTIPDGVGGRFSIFTAVGLLPAAVVGLDIVQLLEGAAAMNQVFADAPLGANPVLDYVAVCHLMEEKRGAVLRILSTWGKGLEAAGLWYDQLLSESLGKDLRGATPITVVNTRDLHSRGQQHQEGRRDKLITNVVVEQCGQASVAVGHSTRDQDQLNELADKTMPEVLTAAREGTNQAYREDGRPTTSLYLPRLDEFTLGQFFQMMMLATVLEGRLMGVNPYGQPGVEAYKRNMNAILRGNA
jgi:glucose-6-phosphate isomerase